MEKANDTLAWLFGKYLEDPNATWNIDGERNHHLGDDISEIRKHGEYLARKGFIKLHKATEQGFSCAITMLGISKISDGLSEVKYKILEASIEHKKRSIMEILGIEQEHVRRVHDYALHFKRLGIIECIFHPHDVLAEPTSFGKAWYEDNKMRFVLPG